MCRVLREIWIAPVKIQQVNSNNSKSQVIEPGNSIGLTLAESKKPLSEGTIDPNDITILE